MPRCAGSTQRAVSEHSCDAMSLQGCDVFLCHTLSLSVVMAAFKFVLWYLAQKDEFASLSYIYQICDKISFLMGMNLFLQREHFSTLLLLLGILF